MKRITILGYLLTTCQFMFGQTDNEDQKIVDEILSVTEKYNQTWRISVGYTEAGR